MSRFLYRLGHGSAAHPWRTIFAWVLVAGVVIGLGSAFGGEPQDDYDVPDARAQVGVDQLREHLPEAGYASAQVVVHDPEGGTPSDAALTTLTERLADMPHVATVAEPRLSEDGDTALVDVAYDVPVTDLDLMGNLEPLEEAVAPIRDTGLQVELGGEVPGTAAAPMEGYGELIGVAAALLILVLAFGSVVGAGLPVAVALTGLGVSSSAILLLAATMDVSTSAPIVATHGGPRRRHRLRAADRHPPRGVPAGRPPGRGRRGPGRRHRRPVGRLRGRHGPGLPDGPAPGRPPGLRLVRLRHRDRRRRRDGRRDHAGAGAVPVRRPPAAAAQGPASRAPGPYAGRAPAPHRPLGGPGRPQPPAVGDRRRAGDGPARAAGARHAHLAAGPEHAVLGPHHPQGVRPRRRASSAPATTVR